MPDDHDEIREWWRRLLDTSDAPPPDVVPPAPASREEMRAHFLRINDAAGTWVPITTPGEVILDPDGFPIGVEPSRVENHYHGGAEVMLHQLEDVGLTPEDVPNLTVWDHPPRSD